VNKRIVIWACLLICLVTTCSVHPVEQAKRQISIGMSREEAIRILSTQAWYHQECRNLSSIDDLFFFGSHDYERADVVIVTSVLEGQSYRVYEVGTFLETNVWHTAYQDCIQRDKFEDQ